MAKNYRIIVKTVMGLHDNRTENRGNGKIKKRYPKLVGAT